MGQTQNLLSNEKITVGVTILDEGGEKYTHVDQLPAGYEITFESDANDIAGVVVSPDGLNATITTDGIGTANVLVQVVKPDGTFLAGTPDTSVVNVSYALPDHANVTWGAPTLETPPVVVPPVEEPPVDEG